ncbi:MAG: helix-turn-helix domain-containing protein [Clostridia bacterium]|nr:helix-turn-helix domain-containing protein [Clostridia bacterium]
MTFSEKLTELRKNAGETQDTLGELLGVSGKTVSKWEGGASLY